MKKENPKIVVLNPVNPFGCIRFFFCFLLNFIVVSAFSQENTLASLKVQLNGAKHDTTKARLNGLLAWELRSMEPEQAFTYADNEIRIGKKLNNPNYLAEGYRAKGLILVIAEKFEEGLVCYDSSIRFAKEAGNLYYESTTTSLIGGYYADLGDYHEAIKFYTGGLELAKKLKDEKLIAQNFNNLAEIYQHAGRETDRIQAYFLSSIKISMEMKDWSYAGMTSANLAKEYARIKEFDKSQTEIKRTLDLMYRDTQDAYRFGTTSHILASAFNDLGKYEQAKKYALISIRIMDSLKRPDNVLRPLTEITRAYIGMRKLDPGKMYAERLIANGFAQQAKLYIRDGYKALSEIAELNKDYAAALKFYEQYKIWNDSIFEIGREQSISNVETKARIAQHELEIKYESEKKSRENSILQEQNETLRRNQLIIIMACILFVLLIALLFFAYRKKNAINKELAFEKSIVERQSKENELLIHEIHHRVKNNLTMLKGILFLQARATDEKEAKRILHECQLRIQSMAMVHLSLYGESKTNSLNFPLFMESMLGEMVYSHTLENKEIEFRVSGTCRDLTILQSIPLGLVMNELITNSIKYAFHSVSHGEIEVQIKEENEWLNISYSDNGSGVKEPFDLQKGGFGFKLLGILMKQLNAQLHYERKNERSFFIIQFRL